jgi:hypothetical protein
VFEQGNVRLWSVVTPPYPDGDLDEHLHLPVGNFTAVTSDGTPAPTATTWILDLPAVVEKRDGPEIPELTSHARPPAQTRGLTVPPASSACLWMEHHEIVPIRADGDPLGSQARSGSPPTTTKCNHVIANNGPRPPRGEWRRVGMRHSRHECRSCPSECERLPSPDQESAHLFVPARCALACWA